MDENVKRLITVQNINGGTNGAKNDDFFRKWGLTVQKILTKD